MPTRSDPKQIDATLISHTDRQIEYSILDVTDPTLVIQDGDAFIHDSISGQLIPIGNISAVTTDVLKLLEYPYAELVYAKQNMNFYPTKRDILTWKGIIDAMDGYILDHKTGKEYTTKMTGIKQSKKYHELYETNKLFPPRSPPPEKKSPQKPPPTPAEKAAAKKTPKKEPEKEPEKPPKNAIYEREFKEFDEEDKKRQSPLDAVYIRGEESAKKDGSYKYQYTLFNKTIRIDNGDAVYH